MWAQKKDIEMLKERTVESRSGVPRSREYLQLHRNNKANPKIRYLTQKGDQEEMIWDRENGRCQTRERKDLHCCRDLRLHAS